MKDEDLKLHLKARYFDMSKHQAILSAEEGLVIFPLWNLSGQLVGYQQYRPTGRKGNAENNPKLSKYFTRRNKNEVCVWGTETWADSNVLYVTEGVFDACRLTYMGHSAIALFSNNINENSSTANWLKLVTKFRPTVAVCDNDKAGLMLANHTKYSHVVEHGDLGEASQAYVSEMISSFSFLEERETPTISM